ncbi:hypothetical protein, partial [Paraburkholderia ultramafica]|uniref:hypothetical protein n=1 Tax=Paraburkholderia ultramafica TaxID=1544867 RepID=UPI001C2EBAE9
MTTLFSHTRLHQHDGRFQGATDIRPVPLAASYSAVAVGQSSAVLQAEAVDIVFPWQHLIRVKVLHFRFENAEVNELPELADRCPTSKRPTLRRRRGMQTAYLDPLRTATASSRE